MAGKRKESESNILSSLISFFGISGNESPVRDFIIRQIRPHVDEVRVDRLGNLIARRKGRSPRVMLAAHMDEIGMLVKRIEQKGLIYCTAVGGVDPAAFVGSAVHIKTPKGLVHGFLTTPEVSAGKYISQVPSIENVFVDTGLNKKQLQALGVEIGTPMLLETHACCEGREGMVLGKALDNRIGCFILIELAKRLRRTPGEIYFVFTVQEEIGLYGAKTSAFSINPDWGIVIDTTHANDVYPEPSRSIGKGPCIVVKDGEFMSNPGIVEWLKKAAGARKIPIQLEASEKGTTDAAIIQTTKGGIPTAAVTIPVRNIHTTAGIASMKDIEGCIQLLEALLSHPPKGRIR